MSWRAWALTCAMLAPAVACREELDAPRPGHGAPAKSVSSSIAPAPQASMLPRARTPHERHHQLQLLGFAPRGRASLAILSAKWCQWCRILERDVLSLPEVKSRLERQYQVLHVDIDVWPQWLDLTGVRGLPSLVLFDRTGRHVWTESGYRSREEVLDLVSAIEQKLATGSLPGLPDFSPPPTLTDAKLSPLAAKAALRRFEQQVFLRVNSHDGGFLTPARNPYPDLLRELQKWANLGAPPRVGEWVKLTIRSALRGSSPRLRGEPQRDMTLDAAELARFSRMESGTSYLRNVQRLPGMDPYLGLQDPVDRGVFRYAAGPGWYHPHFERRTADNLAWALVLRAAGQPERAREIEHFVLSTLVVHGQLASAQRADPFYYRLTRSERAGVSPPSLVPVFPMAVQARAARVFPDCCTALALVNEKAWPRALSGVKHSSPATADDVGELLLALASCQGDVYRRSAATLADLAVARWKRDALAPTTDPSRLHRLAAGLCRARSGACSAALAAVVELPLSLDHAPPLVALAHFVESN